MQKRLVQNQPGALHPSIASMQKQSYQTNLNDDDILSFCDLLLMPGIHYVSFGSLKEGRQVINLFIDVLKCYHTIGFIDRIGIKNRGMNLYELFSSYKDNTELRLALDQFFIENFTYDFIWIVYPKYSVAHTFINIFLDEIIAFNLEQKIPIVFVSTVST